MHDFGMIRMSGLWIMSEEIQLVFKVQSIELGRGDEAEGELLLFYVCLIQGPPYCQQLASYLG